MSIVNIPENNFQLYFKHQNMTKTLLVKQKRFLGCLQLLQKFGLLLKHAGKLWEVQKSLLTGTGRTGKFRSRCSRE